MIKKKKIIISLVLIVVLFVTCFLFKNNKKEDKKKLANVKKISVKAEEKFESKLYAQVINDVINDYSYHDYNEEMVSYENIYDVSVNTSYAEEIIEELSEEVNEEISEEELDENVQNDEEKEEIIEETPDENECENNEDANSEKILEEEKVVTKTGFYEENGITYYYEEDNKITGVKNIDGVNNYFSPSGKYLGTSNVKVLDISYYQGDINWDELASNGDFYGVILRVGYYTFPDKKFEEYISNVKRLNIPYGIYLFSYATDINGSNREASFTNNMIDKYDLKPTLGIYYDIESWTSTNATSDSITKYGYDEIIENYINSVSNHIDNAYKVKVYSGRWYAMNRLGSSKRYVDWVAEYNSSCLYDDVYSMWQYTSTGSMPGINGNVDISYLLT